MNNMTSTKQHQYAVRVEWTGHKGRGTTSYTAYGRDHEISAEGKAPIHGSSDPAFRGDSTRWNPEDLLVASLSACHKLWYLHLCATNRIVVLAYSDDAEGTMVETSDGGGRFVDVCLRPKVLISPESKAAKARALHASAHRLCFIANSVNFPVRHEPEITVAEREAGGKAPGDAGS